MDSSGYRSSGLYWRHRRLLDSLFFNSKLSLKLCYIFHLILIRVQLNKSILSKLKFWNYATSIVVGITTENVLKRNMKATNVCVQSVLPENNVNVSIFVDQDFVNQAVEDNIFFIFQHKRCKQPMFG